MMGFLATYGAQIVLPVFLGLFFAYGFWAYRPRNAKKMKDYGMIPFKE